MVLDYPQYSNGMYELHKRDFDDIARLVMEEYMPEQVDVPKEVDINYRIYQLHRV